MQKLVKEYLDERNRRHRKSRRVGIAVLLLAVIVAGSVMSILTQYGIAMTGKAQCGFKEHEHGKDCYEEALVCSLQEGIGHTHTDECRPPKELNCGQEESAGHTHTDECRPPKELICGQEESAGGEEGTEAAISEGHTHTDACYAVPEGFLCGMEESEGHTHTDACYTVPEGFLCGMEEGEGHTHTDDCYEKELICKEEEHIHTDACYIDTDADVEDPASWDRMYTGTEWSGHWGKDLADAARAQIGYKESTANYTIGAGGVHKGYTRYGHFAGNMYADWDAAFVGFCMHYAGIKESGLFPEETDTAKWQEEFIKIREENAAFLTAPADYEPKTGDLVFLQRENQETPNQMGIVSAYDSETREIEVIEGNSGNEVRVNRYPAEDQGITAYLKLTELASAFKNTHVNEENIATTDEVETADSDIPAWVAVVPAAQGDGKLMLELRYGDKKAHNEKPEGSADRAHLQMIGYFDLFTKDIEGNLELGDVTLTIHLPKKYIDKNSIGFMPIPQDQIPHEMLGVTEEGDYYNLSVKFLDYEQTGQMQYEFHMNFIGGIVPEDYQLKVFATIEAGGKSDDTAENIYRATYEKPNVIKYVNTNLYDNMSKDYTKVSAEIDGEEIKDGEYVSFWYKLGGADWYIREYDTVTLTDILPVYQDKDGNDRVAKFDPEVNPGWTIGSDKKTVSYTVHTDQSCTTRADGQPHWIAALDLKEKIQKVELKLQFPGCAIEEPLLDEKQQDTGFLKKDLLNQVQADCHPHDPSEAEKNDIVNDNLIFTLTDQPVGGGFAKYNSSNVIMDTQIMRSKLYQWGIQFENSESVIPFENITVTDFGIDDRLKLSSLRLETENKSDWMAESRVAYVEAVTYEGETDRYETADFSRNVYEYGWGYYQELVLNPEKEYKEFYIHMKDDYKLKLGQKIRVGVYTTFRNPDKPHYIRVEEGAVQNNVNEPEDAETTHTNSYVNKAKVEYWRGSTYTTIMAQNSFLLIETNENIKIQKQSLYGDVVLGQKDKPWMLEIIGALRDGVLYEDMRIVDLLPESFEFARIGIGGEYITETKVKENYKNSGRNAVIFHLNANKIKEVLDESDGETGRVCITYYTNVPEDASVGSFTNQAYLLSDDFEDVTTQESEPDRYDLDGDGDQGELIRKAEAVCIVKAPSGVYAEKFIAPAGTEAWRKKVDLFLGVGDSFQYKLSVVNSADMPHKGLVVYDVMPKIDDFNISHSAGRGSEYTVNLSGPITPPAGYQVYYTDCREVYSKSMDEMADTDIWMQEQTASADIGWDKITAFKFVAEEGTTIPAKQRQDFIIPVKVTDTLSEESYKILEKKESVEQTSGSTTSLKATNSFGYRVKTFSGKNMESNFVSAQILFAGFTIRKVDVTETDQALRGAKFKLEKQVQKEDLEKGQEELWEAAGEGTSDQSGLISFKHLTEGIYRLTEIEAPEGYSLAKRPIPVEITLNRETMEYVITIKDNEHAGNREDPFLITNHKTYELPNAGGRGIYWYSIGGTLLMLAGALILYRNKRKEVLGG